MEKYGTVRHARGDNIIQYKVMRFSCRITKARMQTHSEYVIFIFYGNNGYANAPRCYVYTYIASLFKLEPWVSIIHTNS